MSRRSVLLTGFVLLTITLVRAGPSLAQGGVGAFPSQVEWSDVVRGGEYLADVGVLNDEDSPVNITVRREGEVADWITVYRLNDRNTKLSEFVVPAHEEARLVLRLFVPPDAPNGALDGTIYLMSRGAPAPDGGGSRSSVTVGLATDLHVSVSGTQRLAGTVTDVQANDTEVAYPLRLSTTFANTGNVVARPGLSLVVKNAAAVAVSEAQWGGDWVFTPGENRTITADWDTSGREPGDYVAEVGVTLAGETIHTQSVGFKLLPRGTLTRLGSLESLTLVDQPKRGGLSKVLGRFLNYGRIDTQARFMGELYRGTTLVDVVSSPDRLVPFGERVDLEMFVRPPEDGDYTLRGKVNYEGKETEFQEITFSVGAPPALPPGIGIAVGAVVALLTGAMLVGRRRRSRPIGRAAARPSRSTAPRTARRAGSPPVS